jgi:hypothetical protein
MNKYNIPVGSLVEVKIKDAEADKKHHGIRLYVSLHRKDSEGKSVYSLGIKGESNTLKMFHGFYEEDLLLIDKISVELTRDEINDIIQWGNTCEEEGWLIDREIDLKTRLSKL